MHPLPKDPRRVRPESDDDWARLLALLPDELDELAVSSGALLRRRVVCSGAMLLRLVLVYTLCVLSLRDTAAWAARTLGLRLTADALAYRFVHAARLLQRLVERLLQQRLGPSRTGGMRLRILDATTLTEPGCAATWRLHLTFCPAQSALVGAELTSHKEAEHLARAVCSAGDLVLGDRGYGHASDVRAVTARGAHVLLRIDLRNVVLTDRQGRRLSPTRLLQAVRRGQHDHEVLLHQRGHEPLAVRLVMVPMPKEKAARARQRLHKRRVHRTGGAPRALTLRLAGYFCTVTTLRAEQASATELVSWYGVRWQVELLFKRCKSLLHLDALAKGRDALVQLQIWAHLLVALLVERLTTRTLGATATAASSVSLWRLTRIHWLDLVLVVYGGSSLTERMAAADATLQRVRERPRRRQSKVPLLVRQVARALGPEPGEFAAAA